MPARRWAPLLLLCVASLLVGIVPPGQAQDSGAGEVRGDIEGHDVVIRYPAQSLDVRRDSERAWGLSVSVTPRFDNLSLLVVPGPPDLRGWSIDHAGGSVPLVPAGVSSTAAYTMGVTAEHDPHPDAFMLPVVVYLLDADDSVLFRETVDLRVTLIGNDLILGQWDNPFPAPLDNQYGIFIGNALAWLVIAGVVALLVDPTLRMLTARTKTQLDDRIIHIIRFPVFLLLFAYGIKQSLEAFALPSWTFDLLDDLYRIVVVIALIYAGYRVWQEIVLIVGKRLAGRTETTLDDRLLPVFEKLGGVIILIVGLFYLLDSFGLNMTLFAAGGAVTSLVIAFAAQDTLSNFFSGIFLMLDQPFKEGDDIILDSGEVCEVTRIGLRTTDLYHRANHETIIVPNNMLAANRTINLLKPDNKYKVRVDVGVAYGSDVQQVKSILMEIMTSHPLTLKDADHDAFVRFQAFGASSLDFSVHGWVGDVYSRWAVASDLREMIDQRFAEDGIEIPFPQHVLWYGRDEAERAATTRREAPPEPPGDAPHLTTTHREARDHIGATSETGSAMGDGDEA